MLGCYLLSISNSNPWFGVKVEWKVKKLCRKREKSDLVKVCVLGTGLPWSLGLMVCSVDRHVLCQPNQLPIPWPSFTLCMPI